MMILYLFTTVPHPHGHWQLQELLGKSDTCTYEDLELLSVEEAFIHWEFHVAELSFMTCCLGPVELKSKPKNRTRREEVFAAHEASLLTLLTVYSIIDELGMVTELLEGCQRRQDICSTFAGVQQPRSCFALKKVAVQGSLHFCHLAAYHLH